MNLAKGNDSVLFRRAQYPKGNFLFVGIDRARGMRFGLARRLLGAASGEDVLVPTLARRLDKRPKAVYKWESGHARPREETVEELAAMCQQVGLPITAGWLERGGTALDPIVIPAEALAPKAQAKRDARAKGRRRTKQRSEAKEG